MEPAYWCLWTSNWLVKNYRTDSDNLYVYKWMLSTQPCDKNKHIVLSSPRITFQSKPQCHRLHTFRHTHVWHALLLSALGKTIPESTENSAYCVCLIEYEYTITDIWIGAQHMIEYDRLGLHYRAISIFTGKSVITIVFFTGNTGTARGVWFSQKSFRHKSYGQKHHTSFSQNTSNLTTKQFKVNFLKVWSIKCYQTSSVSSWQFISH